MKIKTNNLKSKFIRLPMKYKEDRKKINLIAHYIFTHPSILNKNTFIEDSKYDLKNSKLLTQQIFISEITEKYFILMKDFNLTFQEIINLFFYVHKKKGLAFLREDKDFLDDQLKMFNK